MNHRILELEGCVLIIYLILILWLRKVQYSASFKEEPDQCKFQGRTRPGPELLPSPGRGIHEAPM